MILKIKGDIVSNEMKEVYDWFGYDCTTPNDVLTAIEEMPKGDRLQVKINSGGGDVLAGQEIYSTLRSRNDVDIEVEGLAASAASVIAMAGKSTISPVGMLMVHDVSVSRVSGNHAHLSKQAETLKARDEALASAYVEKTGKSREEIIQMMDAETWITADKAVELGFIDAISQAGEPVITNSIGNLKVTDEMIKKYEAKKADTEKEKNELLKDLDKFGA
nr:head maturation protease, ClpP-related [uncultured Lachnoanaerobaculum sp.]